QRRALNPSKPTLLRQALPQLQDGQRQIQTSAGRAVGDGTRQTRRDYQREGLAAGAGDPKTQAKEAQSSWLETAALRTASLRLLRLWHVQRRQLGRWLLHLRQVQADRRMPAERLPPHPSGARGQDVCPKPAPHGRHFRQSRYPSAGGVYHRATGRDRAVEKGNGRASGAEAEAV